MFCDLKVYFFTDFDSVTLFFIQFDSSNLPQESKLNKFHVFLTT